MELVVRFAIEETLAIFQASRIRFISSKPQQILEKNLLPFYYRIHDNDNNYVLKTV